MLVCRDGRVKLTDFGIARSVGESSLTATGLLLGSPAYISPEVASGASATPASDAWGLGALLFACVQGSPPFDRGSPLRTLTSVVNDLGPGPSGFRPAGWADQRAAGQRPGPADAGGAGSRGAA